MANQIGQKSPSKFKPTYLNAILMVSLVLFLLGIIGAAAINYTEFSRYIKESITIAIFVPDNYKDAEIQSMRKKIEAENFVKKSNYISKDQALKEAPEMLGLNKNDVEILDYNPYPASINIGLKETYVNPDSISVIKNLFIEKYKLNEESLNLREEWVTGIDNVFRNTSLIIVGLCALFLLIIVALIDSAVRLSMYSNRFLLKSMQLVGATKRFIIAPYAKRSMVNGLVSGLLASLGILGALYFMYRDIPETRIFFNPVNLAGLIMLILGLGMVISWLSTMRAVNKYLNSRLDDLY